MAFRDQSERMYWEMLDVMLDTICVSFAVCYDSYMQEFLVVENRRLVKKNWVMQVIELMQN